MLRRFFAEPRWIGSAALATVALADVLGGPQAAIGSALGIAGGVMSLWVLTRVVGLLGDAAREQPAPRTGAIVTVLAFVLKLPVLVGLAHLCYSVGSVCSACFLAGVALVYCALLGWVVARE